MLVNKDRAVHQSGLGLEPGPQDTVYVKPGLVIWCNQLGFNDIPAFRGRRLFGDVLHYLVGLRSPRVGAEVIGYDTRDAGVDERVAFRISVYPNFLFKVLRSFLPAGTVAVHDRIVASEKNAIIHKGRSAEKAGYGPATATP